MNTRIIHCIIAITCALLFNSTPALSQLSFSIDSVAFIRYGELHHLSSYENSALFYRGPDVFVYGRLNNFGDAPIVLELSEMVADDELTIHRELLLYVSYHNKKDYYYAIDPLFATNIRDYPYLSGMSLPGNMVSLNGKTFFYSIIEAGESIPLAFETLSVPQNNEILSHKCQRRAIKAIETTIGIIPIVHSFIDPSIVDELLPILLEKQEKESPVSRYETSIPQFFLDNKPCFTNGGISGFYKWISDTIDVSPFFVSGIECHFMVSFVVSKEGDVVYLKVLNASPEDLLQTNKSHITDVLMHSPKWQAGELNGQSVDSRITISLSIDANGRIKEVLVVN